MMWQADVGGTKNDVVTSMVVDADIERNPTRMVSTNGLYLPTFMITQLVVAFLYLQSVDDRGGTFS
jgi:hypothetical protein